MHVQTHLVTSDADDLRERHAERGALETCRSATFLTTVKHFGLEPGMTACTPKGKNITIDARDIWAARKKFFSRFELDQQSCRLTVSGDMLVELFYNWLLHEYSERYRCLGSEEQQRWLKSIVMLVVARHLMETKYTLYLQGVQSFADGWVCGVLCHLQVLGRLPAELARMAHHIIDNPEQQTDLIEQFYVNTDIRMTQHQFVLPEPLPSLPKSEVLPFALLTQRQETSDE